MNLVAALDLASVALAACVAALAQRFARAPGWRDQRWFAVVAATVAGYSALHLAAVAGVAEAVVAAACRAQVVVPALHCWGWIRYSAASLGLAPPRDRLLAAALALAGGLAATPWGAGDVSAWRVPGLGLEYRAVELTALGKGCVGVTVALLAVPLARFASARRRGVPRAGIHAAALALLLGLAVNDVLAGFRILPLPLVGDFGYVVPLAAVGWALTSRFAADARALQALRLELQHEVAERTRELGATQDQLHRAEKLAAIGQFAAGVAHEVNNPSAVVAANLRWLADEARAGRAVGGEARDAIEESIVAMDRITSIVRQLLDSSRIAGSPAATSAVALRPAVEEAMRTARARCGERVTFVHEVGGDLHAEGQDSVLVQVLVNLVVNAAQAIPAGRDDGLVRVTAERGGRGVRIAVEDNGSGMGAEVLGRIFEPFYTTRPFGSGTGLGLPVSRGLVASLGGELVVTSRPDEGTRAVVELPLGDPARAAEARRAQAG